MSLGVVDDHATGVGGWGIAGHHFFDPVTSTLHLSSGARITVESASPVTEEIARVVSDAAPDPARPVVVDGDGRIYFADRFGRIRRLDGVETASLVTPAVFGGGSLPGPRALGVGELRDPVAGRIPALYVLSVASAPDDMFDMISRIRLDTGEVATLVGGSPRTGTPPYICGTPGAPPAAACLGPARPLAAAGFVGNPRAMAISPEGAVYFASRLVGFAGLFSWHILRYVEQPGGAVIEYVAPTGEPVTEEPTDMRFDRAGDLLVLLPSVTPRLTRIPASGGPRRTIMHRSGTDDSEGAPVCDAGTATCAMAGFDTLILPPRSTAEPCGYAARPAGEARVSCIVGSSLFTYMGLRRDVPGFPARSVGTPASRTSISLPRGIGVRAVTFHPDGRLIFVPNRPPGAPFSDPGSIHAVTWRGARDLTVAHRLPSADGSLVYDFDPAGQHVATRDAITNAVVHEFGYDALGRIDFVRDAELATTRFEWTDDGRSVRVVAPGGVTTTLMLNAEGYLERWIDPAGSEVVLGYDTALPGLLTSMTDARGGDHAYSYDAVSGRLLTDTAPLDAPSAVEPTQSLTMPTNVTVDRTVWREVTLSLPAEDGLTASARTVSYRTRRLGRGLLERRVERAGASVATRVPADGGDVTMTRWDGSSSVTTMSPDPRPDFGMAAAFPASTTLSRPSVFSATAVATTVTRTRTFDEATHRLTSAVTMPPVDPAPGAPSSTFSSAVEPRVPGGTGFVSRTTPASGDGTRSSRTLTDARGRPIRIEMPGMYPTCIEYPDGFAVRPSLIRTAPPDASGGCTAGAPSTRRREVRFAYDAGPGLRWLTEVRAGLTDAERLVTTIVPDARGWTDTLDLPGRTTLVDIDYDAHGNIVRFVPPSGHDHGFSYTPRDRLMTTTPPDTDDWTGPEVVSSDYRANGSLRAQTYRNGATLRTELEPSTGYLHRLFVEDDTFANDLVFTNDVGGRPTLIEGTMGNLGLAWGGPVLERETWVPVAGRGANGSVERRVGSSMLLESETSTVCTTTACPARSIDYRYDLDRLLVSAMPRGGLAGIHLGRTFVDGVTLTARSGGTTAAATDITTTWDTDGLGELTYSETLRGGTRLFEERICERDEHGRVTRRAERLRTSTGRTTVRVYRYEYDVRGFLEHVTENVPASGANGNANGLLCGSGGTNGSSLVDEHRFAYDDGGNRTDQAANEEDQPEVGGRTYDALGQLETRGTRTFGYDTLGQLRTSSDGASRVDYDYDPMGRLTAIRPSGTSTTPLQRFIYRDGLNPVAWQRATTSASCAGGLDSAFFVYASLPHTPDLMILDRCSDGTVDATYRLISDARGSVRSVVDAATGDVVEQILYDAWGNPRTADLVTAGGRADPAVHEPRLQPFGFIGGIWDGETRLWRLGARDYDPEIGRWTTKDPIGFEGGYNLYGYCDQDPVNCTDPTGLYSWEQFGDNVIDFGESDLGQGIIGFGDTLAFGLPRVWREFTDTNAGVRTCSAGYRVGEGVGFIWGIAMSMGMAAANSGRAIQAADDLVQVTSWAEAGITPDLNVGRWVMVGGPTRWNYLRTGLFAWTHRTGRGILRVGAPFENYITGFVRRSQLQWPTGVEFIKGFFGQRILGP